MTRAVLFDTETTGLDPLTGDRVIEVACLELIGDLPSGKTFHKLINPRRDIPDEATRIHGITLDRLRDAPLFEEIAAELVAFLGDGPLIAHNAPFDFGFLDSEFSRIGLPALDRARMIDTAALARKKYPGMPASLDALCRRFEIDLSARTTHNALLDCRLLAEVYVELTGGRQRGLSLAEAGQSEMPVARYAAVGARTPRRIVPSAAAQAAHQAFVAKLPDKLWED